MLIKTFEENKIDICPFTTTTEAQCQCQRKHFHITEKPIKLMLSSFYHKKGVINLTINSTHHITKLSTTRLIIINFT